MIKNDLLITGGQNKVYIINAIQYKIVRTVEVPNSKYINGFCMINKNMFLIGDENGGIIQWEIKGNNLIYISKKEKCHNEKINALINIGDGHIASGSEDESIKIW